MATNQETVDMSGTEVLARIRRLVGDHGQLALDAAALPADADLYDAGLSSMATVQVMLAIEEAFDLEFPDKLLNRGTFRNLAAISLAVTGLLAATSHR